MIIDLQRRLAEIGRIRIGQQVPTGRNGKTRPEKLTTFRLTSPDRVRIDHAARMYGGEPKQWQAPAGKQWEVITGAEALEVIVPPSDMAFSQHYELWSAGGCQRRCDGRRESISDGDCVCDPDARECAIHTRLSVLLRDLPGLGVWRIDTSGYYAAVELQGAVEVIQIAAGKGQMLPARLRLEQRQVKRPDQPVRRFAVPVLDVEVSPGQLMAGGGAPPQITQGRAALTMAPPAVEAAEPTALTPVPASVPSRPVRSVADQARAVDDPPDKPARRNAAQPMAPTGIRPRTAAQAHAEDRDAAEGLAPAAEVDKDAPGTVTRAQLTKLWTVFSTEIGLTANDKPTARATCERIIGRKLEGDTTSDMSLNEARSCIDALEYVCGLPGNAQENLTEFLGAQRPSPDGDLSFTATKTQIGRIQSLYASTFGFKRAERAQLIPTTEQLLSVELGTQNGIKTHNSLSRNQAATLIETLARIEAQAGDGTPRDALIAFLATAAQDAAGEPEGAQPDGGPR